MKDTQILMHGNIKVAECRFDARGYLKKVNKVFDMDHLPISVLPDSDTFTLDLQRWILSRSLSANRRDIAPLREFYGGEAFLSRMGLSLFDSYWFATKDIADWEAINPYDHWNEETDSVTLMFMCPEELRMIDANSPNLTIPGRMHRLWHKEEDKLFLLYGDAQKEMAAYKQSQGSPIVNERSYKIVCGQIYAATEAETSKGVERVSLEEYYNACSDPEKSKSKNMEVCCEKYGFTGWKDFIMEMSLYDDRIGNTSRELCDVGILRDAKTLEFVGFAKL